jgi:predicted dehydrogenase
MQNEIKAHRNDSGVFRVAILGAGGIAPEHVIVLRRLPGVRLVAVCDINPERAKLLADSNGISQVFHSPEKMLDEIHPDVVHVLLPPAAHVSLASQCLRAGANVLIEKPIGISTKECAELGSAAKASGRIVGVNHNMVWMPVVQRLINEIRSPRFGRIVHVNVGWGMSHSAIYSSADSRFFLQAPQNVLFEWAVHPLSVVRRLLGNLTQASSLVTTESRTANGRPYYSSWQSSLKCERGTAQLMIAVGDGFEGIWMDVLGEDALAHINITHDTMVLRESSPYRPAFAAFQNAWADSCRLFGNAWRNAKAYLIAGVGRPVPSAPSQAAMHDSIKSFYDALARHEPPPEGLAQGTAVVEYCEGIFSSAFPKSIVGAV